MSDGDCPANHTRSADLKRRPLPDMDARDLNMATNHDTDESLNTSFKSATQSPKTPQSPGMKKRTVYPKLPSDSPNGEGVDQTDSSRLSDSHGTPRGMSHKDKNQSAKKARSPQTSKTGAKQSARATGDRIKQNQYPSPEPVRQNLYPNLEPVEPARGGGVLYIIIACVVAGLALAAGLILVYYPTPEMAVKLSATDIFLRDFKELKNSFPSQDTRFWKIIGSQVKRVLSNDSTYPAVILLGTPGGYEALGTCLAKRVISALNNVARMSGEMYIDTASLDQGSAAKTKFDLDQNLKSIFDSSKGAIIDNVRNLPAKAALLLHGYCDGDNAPYKDVVLFLMLHTELTQDKLNDKVVEKSLTDLWGSELGVDEMPALCSRIANNIVVLSPEEDETLATCT